MSYNGFKNYQTWTVALWLDNEQGSYDECRDMTRRATDKNELAKQLKSFVEEMAPDLGASMFADLLGAALSEVDWYEIAEHYWADNREDEETEEEETDD